MSPLSSSLSSRFFDATMLQPLASNRLLSAIFRSSNESFRRYFDFIANEFEPLLAKKRIAAEILGIIDETSDVRTFVLRPSVNWTAHLPGQYVSVEVDIKGVRHHRHYSLSCSPSEFKEHGIISITVKRVSGGRVSNYLHDHFTVGQLLHISPPAGDFVMDLLASDGAASRDESVPVMDVECAVGSSLFIAAGSGITPIMSMIESLAAASALAKPLTLIYVVRSSADVIFAERLTEIAALQSNFSFVIHETSLRGRLTKEQLAQHCTDMETRQIYVCGPYAFMEFISQSAEQMGAEPSHIKRELFGLPRTGAVEVAKDGSETVEQSATSGQVSFSASGQVVQSSGSKSLLELAEDAGLNPKYGCRAGICHECKCQKTSGRVMNMMTGKIIPDEQDQIQACISAPIGDLTVSTW